MADWYGQARSNYFRVRDEAEFKKWAHALDLDVIEDEGRLGVICETHNGGWPQERYDEEEGECYDVDFVAELSKHLQEGSVAVLMEIGCEKMRYLTGHAVAVNCKGETVNLNLAEIYDRAKPLGAEITVAAY